jgi:hypothetical protein
MDNDTKTLMERARALSPEDRIALVEDVLDSLDHAAPKSINCGRGRRPTVWRPIDVVSLPPRT